MNDALQNVLDEVADADEVADEVADVDEVEVEVKSGSNSRCFKLLKSLGFI